MQTSSPNPAGTGCMCFSIGCGWGLRHNHEILIKFNLIFWGVNIKFLLLLLRYSNCWHVLKVVAHWETLQYMSVR